MGYRLTNRAAEDIVDIYLRGAFEFGLPQADKYHQGLADVFGFLASNPKAARERAELTPPVRIHSFGSHVVIYVTDGPDILVVRVLHGRQDWARHL